MEQKNDESDGEIKKTNIELSKQMEMEAKETVEKEINDISLSDVQILIKKMNGLLVTDSFFPERISKYIEFKMKNNIVYLFHKLKYICFKKEIPVCFLLIGKESLQLIFSIELNQKISKTFILNTSELMNFVFLKIFRLGEKNSQYLKDENFFLNFFKNNEIAFDKRIISQPMKPPETNLEKLFTQYMYLMNSEWKNENYIKFMDMYKLYKFDNDFINDFCEILLKNVTKNQREFLIALYKNINSEQSALKDKIVFNENEIVKNDGDNEFIENINLKNTENAFKLKATICSFLNTEGGRIYIGINDKNQVLGLQYSNKEKDKITQDLYNILYDFHPSVRKGEIKSYFIPIKNKNDEFIEGLYIIKIVVPQGDVNELYSIESKKYRSFVRIDGKIFFLDCELIKKEIVKRFKKEKKTIDNSIFNDKEPIQPIFQKMNFYRNKKKKKYN